MSDTHTSIYHTLNACFFNSELTDWDNPDAIKLPSFETLRSIPHMLYLSNDCKPREIYPHIASKQCLHLDNSISTIIIESDSLTTIYNALNDHYSLHEYTNTVIASKPKAYRAYNNCLPNDFFDKFIIHYPYTSDTERLKHNDYRIMLCLLNNITDIITISQRSNLEKRQTEYLVQKLCKYFGLTTKIELAHFVQSNPQMVHSLLNNLNKQKP